MIKQAIWSFETGNHFARTVNGLNYDLSPFDADLLRLIEVQL